MGRQSILKRHMRHRIPRDFELQLTSLMDALIIIVVFLLKSYAVKSMDLTTSSNIQLPTSTVEEVPPDAVNLMITPENIIFDHEKILDFQNITHAKLTPENATYQIEPRMLGDENRRILPLYDAMVRSREKAELLMSNAIWIAPKGAHQENRVVSPPKFQGIVLIQADKGLRYDLLRKVMYTAGAAQYKIFKLIATRKEN